MKNIKEELLKKFQGVNHLRDIDSCKFYLGYENLGLLKKIGLPKRISRKYYLYLKYGNIEKKVPISYSEKEDIKRLVVSLYKK